MPKDGRDEYQAMPGAEKLSWVDRLRANMHSDFLETDTNTGATVNPRKEFLRERIKVRQTEAAEEQRRQADEMKRKLKSED